MLPTMQQIADEAGVSVATVSRVLSRPDAPLARRTRERVNAIAERLGYRPNLLVRGIRQGRSGTVGVLTRRFDGRHARILAGVHDALAEHGCLPLITRSGGGADEGAQLNQLIDRRVDGVIINTTRADPPRGDFRGLERRGVPFVSLGVAFTSFGCDGVVADHAGGARLAAEHLLALGHRRMAVVLGEGGSATPAPDRRGAAFARRVEAAGGTCRRVSVPEAGLVRGRKTPTAVFAVTDALARATCQAAAAAGLRLPGDLSVVGFGDEPFAPWAPCPLTTVAPRYEAMGARAVELLLRRLSNDDAPPAPRRVRVPADLIVRASTAAPSTSG